MDSSTKELITTLEELAMLLESDGDRHWSAWMRRAKSRLENLDYSGAEYLLSAYGGMGSFNDLILGQTQIDGQLAWKAGHIELNGRFDELRYKASGLARRIQKSGR
ncbi:DUF6966 domain-containing protein [Pseudoxanthomonas japonensis]|uniref:DUF6966 domain-containing protein n=1 Tax=Pseudoxanthomonas japonensis TaxID=69284 RepID=A0ABQ6ZIC3_9GAMM|nr:hypothetical protein [Pseudoxanthomonas japonensis]KAF1725771.1 hypothetical protein CSC78_07160 [Pseudoxanthomonas japonensis]